MARLKQTRRLFSFESPLGPDKLLVKSFRGTEGISKLFHFNMELVSDDHNIDYDAILGKNVTVGIRQADGQTFRYWNGHISRFRQVPGPGRLALYLAEMAPWTWFLTLTQDCFIYQKKKVPDVIKDMFQKFGFQDFEDKLAAGTYEEWEYCCQYRETAYDFVARLMEIEGIYYFFRHEQGKHKLVLVDSKSAHQPCPYQSQFRYEHSLGGGYQAAEDTVYVWHPEKKVRTGKYTHKEFNFEIPWQELKSEKDTTIPPLARQKLEIYDYPGEYEYKGEGDNWVKHRLEQQEVDHHVITGSGKCVSMQSGYRFDLVEHERGDQNSSYLITDVTHEGHEGSFLTGADAGEATYENSFNCIPASVQYRMPETERTQMLGSQTATVVGPKGEEIHTDKYGRVRVQFHWDRIGKKNEGSSCFIRVMQPWTGNLWGQIWIPRIGQEVVVDFLEGDPDRPIITGCVYNAENMPPYKLADHQTRSGVKTRSTKGGKEKNYNELRLEDKMGEELFLLHAERDMDVSAEKDLNELVEGDRHIKVKGEHREKIEGEMSHLADKSRQEKVGQDYILSAGGVIHLKASHIILDAEHVTYLASGSHIDITKEGVIIEGPMVWVNCGMSRPGGARDAEPQDPKKGVYEKESEKQQPAQPAQNPAERQPMAPGRQDEGRPPRQQDDFFQRSPEKGPSNKPQAPPVLRGRGTPGITDDSGKPVSGVPGPRNPDKLKGGGASGITQEFGKPLLISDPEPTQDKLGKPLPPGSDPGPRNLDQLKGGGSSGITQEFGKPLLGPGPEDEEKDGKRDK